MEDVWVCSANGEDFGGASEFSSKERAIAESKRDAKENGDKKFYVGRKVEFAGNYFASALNVYAIIESMQEQAAEEGGEWGEDYLDSIKPDHLNELDHQVQKVVSDWIIKHGYTPKFFRVRDIEEIVVGEETDQ